MSSEIKANKISPATGTDFQFGDSGDTFTIPSGVTLTNNGSSSGFDSGLASVQIFTSSGTWTKPSGITKVMVEVQGAGGGGDNEVNYRRSGAAGGYVRKLIDVTSISSATITVGSGGSSVSSVGATKYSGGDSIWSDGTNTLTSGGGQANGTSSSIGGTATGGDINIVGQSGESNPYSGGGNSILGLGATSAISNTRPSPDGVTPTGYGAGGGSGAGSGSSMVGGPGGDGIVIVTEYK